MLKLIKQWFRTFESIYVSNYMYFANFLSYKSFKSEVHIK